ncbi:MAG: MFS transporter, partial [Lachnospiraceae bacterium]|nr:MFS transporter [Lachnospiraceae bacterium]
YVCMACFFLSAVMEIFIKIPYKKQVQGGSILYIAKEDLLKGLTFIRKDQPVIGKVLIITCGLNLFLSAMIITGLPYLITEVLGLGELQANKLCGYAEGALAAGGLAGGIFAGVLASKLSIKKAGMLLSGGALSVFPVSIALILPLPGIAVYTVMTICFFIIMVLSTIFTIQMLSFVQSVTPQDLTGKVIAVILAGSMCSQPLGNALYGIFFEICKGYEFAVILFAGVTSLIVAISSKNIFKSQDIKYGG